MDHNYKTRLCDAIDQAIILASLDADSMVATVKTGEAVVACLTQITILLAMSRATASPDETEALCNAIATALAARITETRKIIGEPAGTLH